jgi:hypothetical protein
MDERVRAPVSGGECRDCGLSMIDGEAMNCRRAQIAEGQAADKAVAHGTLVPLIGEQAAVGQTARLSDGAAPRCKTIDQRNAKHQDVLECMNDRESSLRLINHSRMFDAAKRDARGSFQRTKPCPKTRPIEAARKSLTLRLRGAHKAVPKRCEVTASHLNRLLGW